MSGNATYFVAPLLLALFGLPAAFAPKSRSMSAGARFSLAFMSGVVVFVVWRTVLSLLHVSWLPMRDVIVLGGSSLLLALYVSRRSGDERAESETSGWSVVAALVGGAALLHLALLALGSRATSIDFFYFWGVKAARFARAGGFDVAFLDWQFSTHTHVPYPPLVPVVGAWGVELAGHLPWRAALLTHVIWIGLAYPVVLRSLRSRMPVGDAVMAAGVWIVGVSLALGHSFSGGNGEPPLLFFATVAISALIAREGTFPGWVPVVAASGLVLTKSEGLVIWALLVIGAALRDLVEKKGARKIMTGLSGLTFVPPLVWMTWYMFLVRNGLPTSDAARESIGVISMSNLVPAIIESAWNLEAGSGWIAWGVAAIVMALSWRAWKVSSPALTVTLGILGFLLVYYLHYQGEALGSWVRWTLPRVSLSALSAAILAAAVASGSNRTSRVEAE